MGSRYLLIALIFLAVAGTLVTKTTSAQQGRDEAKFDDKFLIVTPKNQSRNSWPIEKVQIQMIAGRPFLCGVGMDSGLAKKTYIGNPVWIALDDISTIEVHPSRQSVRDSYKANPPMRIE